jgi:hypothetical protein
MLAVEAVVLAGPSLVLLGYMSALVVGISASSVLAWVTGPSAFATVPDIPLVALGVALAFLGFFGLAALLSLLGALAPAIFARSLDRAAIRGRLATAFRLGFIPLLVATATAAWPYWSNAAPSEWTGKVLTVYLSGLPLLVPMLHLWALSVRRSWSPVPRPEALE